MLLIPGKGNGEWGMGNGKWGMGNGEWEMGNGEWGMGNGEWGMGNGERGTGNGERGTGNGEWGRGTGNGERGTGNGERGTGNECTAVTRLRIQNGEQNKRKGPRIKRRNNLKREFLPAVALDDQYVLVRAESDWHWDKQSIVMAPK